MRIVCICGRRNIGKTFIQEMLWYELAINACHWYGHENAHGRCFKHISELPSPAPDYLFLEIECGVEYILTIDSFSHDKVNVVVCDLSTAASINERFGAKVIFLHPLYSTSLIKNNQDIINEEMHITSPTNEVVQSITNLLHYWYGDSIYR